MDMEGDLIGRTPWATTLAGIARTHPTAELVIEAGDKCYRIAFEGGAIVGAVSPLTTDSAVRIATVNHFVPRSLGPEITKRVTATPDADELDILVETATLTTEQAAALWKLIIAQRAARTFALDSGRYSVTPEITIRRLPGTSVDLGPVIYQGTRLNLPEDRLDAQLRGAGTYFVMRPDADLTRFGFDETVQPLIDALSHGSNLPELEAKHRDVDPRTLRALIATLVACEQCEAFFEAAVTPTVLSPELPPIAFKKTLDGSYSETSVGRDVVAEPITYRVARPTTPPPVAYELSDEPEPEPVVARAPTAEIEASEAFSRALEALRIERYNAAIFELEEALEKAPKIVDYLTYLAWAQFCAATDKQELLEATREACKYSIEHSPTPIVGWLFLGRVERTVGNDREALRCFQEVLAIDPEHADAAAEVEAVEARLARTATS